MPLRFEGVRGGVAHGVALWFDVEFEPPKNAEAKTGKSTSSFLSTAGAPDDALVRGS